MPSFFSPVRARATRGLALAALAALLLGGCQAGPGADPATPEVAARVAVTPSTATLFPRDSQQLSAVVYGTSGAALSGRAVAYSTSDANVAAVSAGGMLRAVAAGTATVRVAVAGSPQVVGTVDVRVQARQHELTLAVGGTGRGTVAAAPAGQPCAQSCTLTAAEGTTVTLAAAPVAGSVFGGWAGACTGMAATCTVTMDAPKSVAATFSLAVPSFALLVSTGGAGAGTVTSAGAGLDCAGSCSANFPSGTVVTLTAVPAPGSTFLAWTGACAGVSTPTCEVTVKALTSVGAAFSPSVATVVLDVSGGGTVTVTPGNVACTASCSVPVPTGSRVTLTATPPSGGKFAGYVAPVMCLGSNPTCTFIIDGATAVDAVFATSASASYPLTLTVAGSGTGIAGGTGINCTHVCTTSYPAGRVVELSAAPTFGSTFAGWSGASCSGRSTCTVRVDAATSVTATFTASAPTYPLTLAIAGQGTVSVGDPSQASCAASCTINLPQGARLPLFASGVSGVSRFGQWGGACGGTAACELTMDGPKTVSATFVTSPPPPESINLTVPPAVAVGVSTTVTAIAHDASGLIVTTPITWRSSDPTVARIEPSSTSDRLATMVPVAAGTVTITASSAGASSSRTLVVTPGPTAYVTILPSIAGIAVKDSVQLSVSTLDAGRRTITGRSAAWSIDNPALVSVSADGLLVGLRPGIAKVTATVDGLSVTQTLNVVPEIVARFTVTPRVPPALHVGETVQLTVVAYDRQGNVLDQAPIWNDSRPGVATVSPTGLVTARAVGGVNLGVYFSSAPSGQVFVPIQVVP